MSTPTYLEVNISQIQNLDISGNTTISGSVRADSSFNVVSDLSSTRIQVQNAANTQYINMSLAGLSFTGVLSPQSTTVFRGVNAASAPYTLSQTELSYLSGVNNPIQQQFADMSSNTQTALNLRAPIANPTFTGTVSGITKSMVGLSNVDNTSDVNKPVSTATQSALDLKAPIANPTFTGTVSGITKTMVGLANVDNTSDVNKPVSTATQTALDLKANDNAVVHLAGAETITGIKTFSASIVANAKTVTTTQLGYLSDLSLSLLDAFNTRPVYSQLLAATNTWTGVNTFSTNNVVVSKSISLGGTTVDADGGIYFPSGDTNRKLVLTRMSNNDFQNYSIGVKTAAMQFMVDTNGATFQFSAAASSSTKTDFARISSAGVNVITGSLLLNGTDLFARTNTWTGLNTFNTNNVVVSKSIGIGAATIQADGGVYFPATTTNRKLVLYPVTNNEFQNYSIGVQGNTLQFMVDTNAAGYLFSCAASSTTKADYMRVNNTGLYANAMGINGATIQTAGGLYFPNTDSNRLIVFYNGNIATPNAFQNHSIGKGPFTMQFLVDATNNFYTFSAATSATAKTDYTIIGNSGVDIKTGSLLINGTDIFARNNTWSGTTTFSGSIIANSLTVTPTQLGYLSDLSMSLLAHFNARPVYNQLLAANNTWSGTNTFTGSISANAKTVTPTQLGYLSDLSLSLLDAFNTRPVYNQLLAANNTWTGTNTFNTNNVVVAKSIGFGSAVIGADGGIYFPNEFRNRKIVLWDGGFNDDSRNFSIGMQSNRIQFQVSNTNGYYNFSAGTSVDYASIGNSGINIITGGLLLAGTSIFARNNTWSGINTFSGNVVANSLTITPTQLGYLSDLSMSLLAHFNARPVYNQLVAANNSWSGTNTFTGSIVANAKTVTPTQLGYLSDLSLSLLDALNSRLTQNQLLSRNNTWTGTNTFGAAAVLNASTIDTRTNTYVKFGEAGSVNDSCYLRQIGGTDQIKLAWDFMDDADDCRMVFRANETSKFEIAGGSIGLNGASIYHNDGGMFFPNTENNRKIVLFNTGDADNLSTSIGIKLAGTYVENTQTIDKYDMQFNVNKYAGYKFTGTSADGTATTDYSYIGSDGFYVYNGNINISSAGKSLYINGSIYDSNLVHLTGTETIAGNKTFTGTVAGITKTMVGLGNVDNTSDANKPISTATQTALNLRAFDASCVHLTGNETIAGNKTFTGTVAGITATMVGLGNVDNTSDADKPISTATQSALDAKAPLANPTFTGTVSGITKTMVGLGNVDNTSDANKPISTATQTALNLRAFDASCVHLTGNETIAGNKTFTGTVAGITAAMVGLGNVDNTSDINKPISIATQAALDAKASATGVVDLTSAQTIGGNKTFSGVTTLSQSSTVNGTLSCTNVKLGSSVQTGGGIYFPTTDLNRKIVLYTVTSGECGNHSIGVTGTGTILQFMVPDINRSYVFSYGTSASTKSNFVTISSAGMNVQYGNLLINGTAYDSNLVHLSGTETITGDKTFTGTVSGITKTMVGLDNVDNTSDANKPISTATQTALNLRAFDASCVHLAGAETITGDKTITGNLIANAKTVTPTQLGYLSDFTTSSIKTYIDTNSGSGILSANNTWTGTNSFTTNHLAVSKSIGLGGATVDTDGGIYFPSGDTNRKLVLQRMSNNDFQNYSIGVKNAAVQFMVDTDGAIFQFSAATSSSTKTDFTRISSAGVNVITGSLLLNGTDIFARTNTWSGTNTFSGTVNGLTKTTVGLGNVDNTSDASKPVSTATQTALNLKANDNAVVHLTGAETISGNKTFSGANSFTTNHLSVSKSIGLAGATVDTDGAIYFPNNLTNRKLMLYRSANNDFQNYSIGVQLLTFQFLVDQTGAGYLFSAGTATPSKVDYTKIDVNGIDILSGGLKIGGTDIFARTNTWTGSNTFSGTVSGLTKSTVGLDNVDNTSDANKPVSTATQTALDAKANDNAVVHLTGNETIAGNKTFSGTINTAGLIGESTNIISGSSNAYTLNYATGGIFYVPANIAVLGMSSLVITNIPTDTTKSYTITVGYYQSSTRFYINQVRVSDTGGTYISGTASTFGTPLYNGGAPVFNTTGQCLMLQQFTIFSISTTRYVLSSVSSFEA